MGIEEIPSWQEAGRGTMVRCALWLVSEVGLGNIFTKTQLREAFPETSQIDRRMRDLRDRGWKIATNREDRTLKPSEQRFVEMGAKVWQAGQVKPVKKVAPITANRRAEIIAADDHLCRACGIAAGEAYEDRIETAQLDIARRDVRKTDGTVVTELVTECRRCRVGGRRQQVDLHGFLDQLRRMSSIERELFAQWVASDRRDFSAMDRLWGVYRTLPAESRQVVQETMETD